MNNQYVFEQAVIDCEKLRTENAQLRAELEQANDMIISMQNYEFEAERQVGRDGDAIRELIAENAQLRDELKRATKEKNEAADTLKMRESDSEHRLDLLNGCPAGKSDRYGNW